MTPRRSGMCATGVRKHSTVVVQGSICTRHAAGVAPIYHRRPAASLVMEANALARAETRLEVAKVQVTASQVQVQEVALYGVREVPHRAARSERADGNHPVITSAERTGGPGEIWKRHGGVTRALTSLRGQA